MSKKPYRKNCVVKRLDFENCVLGGFKQDGKKKWKRQLRARMLKDLNSLDKTPEKEVKCCGKEEDCRGNKSPVLMPKKIFSNMFSSESNPRSKKENSPVFFCRNKGSPPARFKSSFRSKRKINFESEIIEKPLKLVKTSPVFKSKTLDNFAIEQFESDETVKTQNFVPSHSKKVVENGSSSTIASASKEDSSQIEDFTQDVLSAPPHISSLESPPLEESGVDCAPIGNSGINQTQKNVSTKEYEDSRIGKSETKRSWRRTYKKHSLVNRLSVALSKRHSEKMLWQHWKKETDFKVKLILLDFWMADGNKVLKCRTWISETGTTEIQHIFVDSRYTPGLKPPSEGRKPLLWMHPPWQKLIVGKTESNVLLNVWCLEPCEEEEMDAKTFENVERFSSEPIHLQKGSHVNILYDALLADSVSPFWY